MLNAPGYNDNGEIIDHEVDDLLKEQFEQDILKKVSARLRCYVKWTKEELAWRMKGDLKETFGRAMTKRIKCSSTGCFVTNWNIRKDRDICQGLLALLDIEIVEGRLDGWCEDELSLIKDLLHRYPEGFSWHQLIHTLKVLRLTLVQISKLDYRSSRPSKLKALALLSNLIKECRGSLLPKDLRYLELYNNCIQDLSSLANDLPQNILYFGIGRNELSTSQSLEVLTNFDHLIYLDISDNDFLDLPQCMEVLKILPSLNCLTLNGTPCSMAVSYRKMVQKEIPQLALFDGVDLKKCPFDLVETNKLEKGKKKSGKDSSAKEGKGKGDKKKKGVGEDEFDLSGELQVNCFKVFAIKEPKKEKNIKNLYFFELECPLIDEGLKEYERKRVEQELKTGIADYSADDQDICDRVRGDKNELEGSDDEDAAGKGKDGKGKDGKFGKDGADGDKSRGKDGKRSSKFGKDGGKGGGKGGKSGADQDGDGNQGKGADDASNKKYLLPIKKSCADRHKFDNARVVGWRQMERKCFFFKDEKIGWDSKEDLENSGNGKRDECRDTIGDDAPGTRSQKGQGTKGKDGSNVQDNNRGTGGKKGKRSSTSGDASKKGGSSKKESAGNKKDGKGTAGGAEDGKKNLNPKLAAKLERELMQNNLLSLIEQDKEIDGCTKFKTKEQEWSRIMEFKQPILVKTTDLMALRDTFRTVLMLRLIHTKVKFSKADKETKKSKKGQENQQKADDNVLLREKLAVIPIPLESIKWNQKYLSYTWDMSKPCEAEKHPNVKEIKYSKAKGKETAAPKSKGTSKVPLPPEPDILTVHLGVGVKRDLFI